VLFWKDCNPKNLDNAVIGTQKYVEPIGIDILTWMNTDEKVKRELAGGYFSLPCLMTS
jgi:hypothetical protein